MKIKYDDQACLQCLDLSFLCAKFAPPLSLGFSIGFNACFELVKLPPSMIKLFFDFSKSFRESRLGFFDTFVKVKLYLAQCLQTGNQVVMEDIEIREGFRFCLATLLLHGVSD